MSQNFVYFSLSNSSNNGDKECKFKCQFSEQSPLFWKMRSFCPFLGLENLQKIC